MSLINWTIGSTSMQQTPASAPGPASTQQVTATATAPAVGAASANPSGMAEPAPGQGPGTSGPPLPSGQAASIDTSTPFFVGGVTPESTPEQAAANYTVVDVPVRTIATQNNTLAATVELAIAHR